MQTGWVRFFKGTADFMKEIEVHGRARTGRRWAREKNSRRKKKRGYNLIRSPFTGALYYLNAWNRLSLFRKLISLPSLFTVVLKVTTSKRKCTKKNLNDSMNAVRQGLCILWKRVIKPEKRLRSLGFSPKSDRVRGKTQEKAGTLPLAISMINESLRPKLKV